MPTIDSNVLEVWIDSDILGGLQQLGMLHHDRGHIRFHYMVQWLDHPSRFNIDPHLSLDKGAFHPHPEFGSFGMLLDSSPDRWGQTLMKRREVQQAKDEGRKPRTLYAWDYLIGVQDQTRQGALRFKYLDTDIFLGDHELSAPPVTELAVLEDVALKLSDKHIDDLDALKHWLGVLVAPGSSLGGARPKANFTETDGSLWIAKFPAKDDDRDMAAWEMLTYNLAKKSLIDLPSAKLRQFGSGHHTFCIKRFDRLGDQRVFYASAMTMLGATESEGVSYLDIANVLQTQGDPQFIQADFEQLFRRVVFNVLVGNKDDHLRNHGFILNNNGWRLSPAFDVNPNIDKSDHVLNLDDSDNHGDLQTVIETASFYDLSDEKADLIAGEVIESVKPWKSEAKYMGISRADIQLMEPAFWCF